MKYSSSRRHPGAGGLRSSSSALSPYFIEDIAMTRGELDRVRATDISVVVPR